jgi:aarF domain-containing kinase
VTKSRVDGVTPTLCLLDFGLIAHVTEADRSNMTRAILNLLQGDYDALISRDAKDLGFLPSDMDVSRLGTFFLNSYSSHSKNIHTDP